ncbi:hypothetical protein L0244_19035, partial [bacterium]|nr:hypothetical protein [bacterium]
IKKMRVEKSGVFDLWGQFVQLLIPTDQGAWITLVGIIIFAAVIGLFVAAAAAARSGVMIEN